MDWRNPYDPSLYYKALELYEYKDYNIEMDKMFHCIAIKACSKIGNIEKGNRIFSNIQTLNVQIKTAIINLYSNCNEMEGVIKIVDENGNDFNIICINAMMTGFLNNKLNEKALDLYDQIHLMNKKTQKLCVIT